MGEKRLPGRERRKRHGRRMDVVERFRLGREILRMDGNEFRSAAITIELSEAVYFFANVGDLRIERKLFDYTGKFVTGNRGSSRLALRGLIGRIPGQLVFCDCRSVHADQRVTRYQHRSWRVFVDQHFWPALLMNPDRLHVFLLLFGHRFPVGHCVVCCQAQMRTS